MAPKNYRNPAQEQEILEVKYKGIFRKKINKTIQWIEEVLDEKLVRDDFEMVLKDGTILCRLMNKIQPNSIKRYKESVS